MMVDSSAPNSLIELGQKHRSPEAKRVLAPVVGFLIAETSILVGQITFGLLVHASMLLMLFWMIATSSESNRVFEAFVFIPLLRLLNLVRASFRSTRSSGWSGSMGYFWRASCW